MTYSSLILIGVYISNIEFKFYFYQDQIFKLNKLIYLIINYLANLIEYVYNFKYN